MELLLKQRLIGAAVIVALAVILIPMLLDGSGTETIQEIPLPPEPEAPAGEGIIRERNVPQPPPMGQPVVTRDTPSAAVPDTGTVSEAPASPEPTAAPEPPPAQSEDGAGEAPQQSAQPADTAQPALSSTPEPEARTDSAPEAWVIQVGSFGEHDKAAALRERLLENQYRAYVERFSSSGNRTMFRVRVGPLSTRAEAESLNEKLLEVKGISDTYVTSHP